MIGLLYFFPSVSLRLANEAWWLKACSGKETKVAMEGYNIYTQLAKEHDIEIHVYTYIYIAYTSVAITILNSKLIRSIQVPLLVSTLWQQDWKWKDKDFGLHGYSAESLRMNICWKTILKPITIRKVLEFICFGINFPKGNLFFLQTSKQLKL